MRVGPVSTENPTDTRIGSERLWRPIAKVVNASSPTQPPST
jgi:hypothetical protein